MREAVSRSHRPHQPGGVSAARRHAHQLPERRVYRAARLRRRHARGLRRRPAPLLVRRPLETVQSHGTQTPFFCNTLVPAMDSI